MSLLVWLEILLVVESAFYALKAAKLALETATVISSDLRAEMELRRCGATLAALKNLSAAKAHLEKLDDGDWSEPESIARQKLMAGELPLDSCPPSSSLGLGVTLHYEFNPMLAPSYPNWVYKFIEEGV